MDGEEQQSNDNFLETVIKMAFANGATVLEGRTCPQCKELTLAAHQWSEVIRCTHCGNQFPSIVSRPPQAGEVTLDHVNTAIQTLIQCYNNVPHAKFISNEEWAKLDSRVQLLLTVNMSAAAIAVLKQVDSLAVALATNGK